MQPIGAGLERLAEALRSRRRNGAARPPAAEEDPVCPRCDGARFVRVASAPGLAGFGAAEPCECALAEPEDELRRRLGRYSRLGDLGNGGLAALDGTVPAGVLDAARAFAARPAGWLLIEGPPASGKTRLAAAIAAEAIAGGRPALYLPAPDLLDDLRESYGGGAEDPYRSLALRLRDAPLAVVDDLGAFSPTPWAREQIGRLAAHRAQGPLPTVFACAGGPDAAGEDRLAARLADPSLTRRLALGGGRYSHVGGMSRERLGRRGFAEFRPDGAGLTGDRARNLAEARALAAAWAEEPRGSLTFTGGPGCGKTHLAAAIAGRALARGGDVFFADAPDLLDELREAYSNGGERGFGPLFRRLREAPLLVLDDFGAHQSTPWAREKLHQLVNYRWTAELPTAVTTNLGLAEIADIDPRIASRLGDVRRSVVYQILAPDYRIADGR